MRTQAKQQPRTDISAVYRWHVVTHRTRVTWAPTADEARAKIQRLDPESVVVRVVAVDDYGHEV